MGRFKSRITRRSAASEAERSWLGAEALPGGALSRETEGPVQGDLPLGAPVTAAGGVAAWLAAALRWTRRGRLT